MVAGLKLLGARNRGLRRCLSPNHAQEALDQKRAGKHERVKLLPRGLGG